MIFLRNLVLIFLTYSCLASNLTPTKTETLISPTELVGEVSLTDGTTLNFSNLLDEPFLLIFAQETCEVCREETLGFKAAYEEVTENNLRIVTVLVGSVLEDALYWKSADNWEDTAEVPWSVGYERRPALFNELCPNSGTPCSLLQLPGQGVVLKHSGLLHPEEVIQLIESEN